MISYIYDCVVWRYFYITNGNFIEWNTVEKFCCRSFIRKNVDFSEKKFDIFIFFCERIRIDIENVIQLHSHILMRNKLPKPRARKEW